MGTHGDVNCTEQIRHADVTYFSRYSLNAHAEISQFILEININLFYGQLLYGNYHLQNEQYAGVAVLTQNYVMF
jgi:hypothetical protein